MYFPGGKFNENDKKTCSCRRMPFDDIFDFCTGTESPES